MFQKLKAFASNILGPRAAEETPITPAPSRGYFDGVENDSSMVPIPMHYENVWQTNAAFKRRNALAVARWLYVNDGYTRGMTNKFARYAFPLRPQAETKKEGTNDAYEAFWKSWAVQADHLGLDDMGHLQRLWSILLDVDGDVGIEFKRSSLTGMIQIDTIEGHRIDSGDLNTLNYEDGVKLNAKGQPRGYRVRDVLRETPYFVFADGPGRDVDTSRFALLRESSRAQQYRGITNFIHGIKHLRDRIDILGYEKIGVKLASSMGMVHKKAQRGGAKSEWDNAGNKDSLGISLADVFAGRIQEIGANDDVKAFESNRPSPAFAGFLEFLNRDIAEGIGLPYEFVWSAEKLKGPSQRMILKQAERRFQERQELFVSQLLNRVYVMVIADGILNHGLPYDPDFMKVRWQGPQQVTIDVGREQREDRSDVLNGLMTKKEHYSRRNLDYKTESKQQAAEVRDILTHAKEIAEETGVDLPLVLGLLQQESAKSLAVPEKQGQDDDKGKNDDNDDDNDDEGSNN